MTRIETCKPRPGAARARHPRWRARRDRARHHAGGEPARRPPARRPPSGAGPLARYRRCRAGGHHRHARRRQVDHHRCARQLPHRAGPQGRGARGRSVLDPDRRIDPGRQDPHGAPVRRSQRLRAPLPLLRHARRGGGEDARVHAAAGGGRLRYRPGRDRRHRPVRDRGGRHDRFLSGADAAGRRRRAAGPQERRGRARRHDRHQQSRRRQSSRAPGRRRRNIAPRCTFWAPARRTGRRRS